MQPFVQACVYLQQPIQRSLLLLARDTVRQGQSRLVEFHLSCHQVISELATTISLTSIILLVAIATPSKGAKVGAQLLSPCQHTTTMLPFRNHPARRSCIYFHTHLDLCPSLGVMAHAGGHKSLTGNIKDIAALLLLIQ